jgi:hypothetical protein
MADSWSADAIATTPENSGQIQLMEKSMSMSAAHQHILGVPGAPFISGRFLDRTSLAPVQHINPSTGLPQAELHLGGAAEID